MNKSSVRPVVWVVAAVAVTATATALITASLLSNNSVRSPQEVADALAAATATAPTNGTHTPTTPQTPTATGSSTVTGTGSDLTSTLTPGIVTVHCDGALATLVSWSPNPGWRSDDPVRGPANAVSVRFESDVAADYKVTATCVDGVPVVNLGPDVDDDDHDDDDDAYDDHGGRRGGSDDDD